MKTWKLVALVGVLIFSVLLALFGVSVDNPNSSHAGGIISINIGDWNVITIGPSTAEASGTFDYTCDGVVDDAQFQAALNALPSTGGKIVAVVPTGGTYNFTASVTRAIPNVVIEGCGQGTYFAYNGVNPIFTVGGTGWVFRDLRTDAGGISGVCTKQSVTEGASYTSLALSDGSSSVFAFTTVSNHLELSDSAITRARFRDNGELEIWNSTGSGDPGIPQLNLYNYKAGEISLRMNHADDDTGSGSLLSHPWVIHVPPGVGSPSLHLNITRDSLGNYMSFDDSGRVLVGYAVGNTEDSEARFEVKGGTDELQCLIKGSAAQTNQILSVKTFANATLMQLSTGELGLGVNLNLNGNNILDAGLVNADEFYGQSATSYLNALNSDGSSLVFRGRDTGVGEVQVAKIYSGGDPLITFGGSDEFQFYNSGYGKIVATYVDWTEMSSPGSPAANTGRLHFKDNGAGKTQLMVTFATGPAQQVAIQP